MSTPNMTGQPSDALRLLYSDASFDTLYAPPIRRLSARHWTPVAVARRAAKLFRDAGCKSVLDVGSGAGKFVLVGAATAPAVAFVGIEQRRHLLDAACDAKAVLRLGNARFVLGDAIRTSWLGFDGLYFFNPFGESLLAEPDRIDADVAVSSARFCDEARRCEEGLRELAVGTVVVTYNGCGGNVPSTFELAHREHVEGAALRVWVKKHAHDDGATYAEVHDTIVLRPRA